MSDRRTPNPNTALLIRLDEKVENLTREVKEMKDGMVNRLERVETGKISVSDFINYKTEQARVDQDQEDRLRYIERYLWMALGVVAIIQLVGFAYIIEQLK
jgi:hypothetical protein